MRPRPVSAFVVLSLAALLPAGAASAQEEFDLGEILVTPNRSPTEKDKVGSKVETVERDEIEAHSLPTLNDYLATLPGVSVAVNGGQGQETSLSVRGAPKRYVKTLFNGIDISDPTAPQVQTSYEHLLAAGIDRLEVLKGSQSTLYGSDAIAGVIDVSTLGGVAVGVRHTVFGEGGSFGTARGGYRMEGGFDSGRFDLSLTGLHTDGISAADARAGNDERDGYRNLTASFAGEYRLNEAVSVFGAGFYVDARAEHDGFPPPAFMLADTADYGTNVQAAGRAGVNFDLFDGRMKNTVSAQVFDVSRETFGSFPGVFDGRRHKLDYQGSFEVGPMLTVSGGLDWEHTEARTSSGVDASAAMASAWTQASLTPLDPLTLTFGGRFDHHDAFGSFSTWRATASYAFSQTGTRLHGSAGSGFRAPSLFELYDPWSGNASLQPEESLSFDFGVEQTFLGGRLVADVTVFRLDVDNLIDYVCGDLFCSFGNYDQVTGTTVHEGVEASAVWRAADWLDLGASYTYTRTERPDGTRNVRVPLHDIGLSFVARPWEKWSLSASARIAIDTVDGFGGGVKLDDYVLLNARIAYKPTEDTEFYLRGENLLDQKYQVVNGYGTPGISAFAGFKASF